MQANYHWSKSILIIALLKVRLCQCLIKLFFNNRLEPITNTGTTLSTFTNVYKKSFYLVNIWSTFELLSQCRFSKHKTHCPMSHQNSIFLVAFNVRQARAWLFASANDQNYNLMRNCSTSQYFKNKKHIEHMHKCMCIPLRNQKKCCENESWSNKKIKNSIVKV